MAKTFVAQGFPGNARECWAGEAMEMDEKGAIRSDLYSPVYDAA